MRAWVLGWIAGRPRIEGACYVHHEAGECPKGGFSSAVWVILIVASAIVVYGFVFVRRNNLRSVLRFLAPAFGVAAAVGAAALAYSWR
jgi:hypothetical protein